MATRSIGPSTWRDVVETLWPPATAKEDGLPPLLIVLTVLTGVVDALAYLRLGHVFVANMTGNVVFLGFAAAGASGLSVPGSLFALAFFLCGGMAVGRLAGRLGNDRRRGLRIAASAELALSTVAVAVAAFSGQDIGAGSRYALIALLALAMGVQNATARRLPVADLTGREHGGEAPCRRLLGLQLAAASGRDVTTISAPSATARGDSRHSRPCSISCSACSRVRNRCWSSALREDQVRISAVGVILAGHAHRGVVNSALRAAIGHRPDQRRRRNPGTASDQHDGVRGPSASGMGCALCDSCRLRLPRFRLRGSSQG
jgi:hypothetical protein